MRITGTETKAGAGRLSRFYGPVAALSAVAIVLMQITRPYGGTEAAFGSLAPLFWIAALVWLIAAGLAIRVRQHWWALASAPFVLYPVTMAGLLLAACLGGSCI
jgi:hypothetical protein